MPLPRRPQPAVAATTSRHQQLLAAAAPPPPHDKAVAAPPPPEDINDDDEDPNNWLNTGATDSLFMPTMEEPYRAREDQNARTKTCTRLDFRGALEETPPDAGAADPKVTLANIFSPNTLHKAADEQLAAADPIEKKKKYRKRYKKDTPPASQRPAAPKRPRVQDDPLSQPAEGTLSRLHEAGKQILSDDLIKHASGPMLHMMHSIMFLEEGLLKEANPSYPVFTVKVPTGMGFVDNHPADIFFISYEDIFKLFNAKRLDYNLVRLYAIHQAMKVMRERNPVDLAIADPYFMRDAMLLQPARRASAKNYIQKFMLDNQDKRDILLPYFFE